MSAKLSLVPALLLVFAAFSVCAADDYHGTKPAVAGNIAAQRGTSETRYVSVATDTAPRAADDYHGTKPAVAGNIAAQRGTSETRYVSVATDTTPCDVQPEVKAGDKAEAEPITTNDERPIDVSVESKPAPSVESAPAPSVESEPVYRSESTTRWHYDTKPAAQRR